MKKTKKKLIYKASIIVLLFLLIGVCTYAWFEDNFDPIIYSNSLKITASDGLFVQLTDDTTTDSVNIKDVVRDFDEQFGLAQVSTVDSINFFKKKGEGTNATYLEAEKNSDYVEVAFMLSGDTEITGTSTPSPDRYIYLKDLSIQLVDTQGNVLTDSNFAADTIRTSIAYKIETDDLNEEHSYLVCRNKEANNVQYLSRFDDFKDLESQSYSSTIIKNMVNDATSPYLGYEIYNAIKSKGNESEDRYGTQKVDYVCQYIYDEADSNFTYMECIPTGTGSKITIDIWLEGADPRCDLPVSGSKLLYNLTFGSYYYKVDFDSNGADPVKPLIFNSVGSEVGELPTPTGASGTFLGWYENNTKWESTTVVSKNTTLVARYS